MLRKLFRALLSVFGAFLGAAIVSLAYDVLIRLNIVNPYTQLLHIVNILIYVFVALVFGIIFFIFSPGFIDGFIRTVKKIETRMQEMPAADLVSGVMGLIVGLVLAFLFCSLFRGSISPWLEISISLVIYFTCAYLSWTISIKRRYEIINFFKSRFDKDKRAPAAAGTAKILDTSVIIDGRILDIAKTGIVEGELIVPGFVLSELRHIADSSDTLKRNRGRRGLDILNSMQKELDLNVLVVEKDYDDLSEVDSKLVRLAQEMGAIVVTNDYNLNKVAGVQNVRVFNINELANSVKPVLLPGEELNVSVVKDGKESGQGVAYLEDGTMIVVEGGRKHIGENVDVVVTSVLQTAAGRMIFARLKQYE